MLRVLHQEHVELGQALLLFRAHVLHLHAQAHALLSQPFCSSSRAALSTLYSRHTTHKGHLQSTYFTIQHCSQHTTALHCKALVAQRCQPDKAQAVHNPQSCSGGTPAFSSAPPAAQSLARGPSGPRHCPIGNLFAQTGLWCTKQLRGLMIMHPNNQAGPLLDTLNTKLPV